jgi:hypothetical protein
MDQAALYRQAKKQLAIKLQDREWRLDNLYWIKDENGNEVKFRRNVSQMQLWDNLHYRNIIPKARQLGFSTFICIIELDTALFDRDTACGIIDARIDDGRKKLEKIRFAYSRLPAPIKQTITLTTDNTDLIEWSNGSSCNVGLSHRGGTLQVLLISELGKTSLEAPKRAREIRSGALAAVSKTGWVFNESTAHGKGGVFHDQVTEAQKRQQAGKVLTPLDFKLHFMPWWGHAQYRLPAGLEVITREMAEYFEELRTKNGIVLDDEQKAWYVAMRNQIGHDDMATEYPSTVDEPFNVAMLGSYFRVQMAKMREQRRIGIVPHDPTLKVNTFWDIGHDDPTAIWFHQQLGNRNMLIDYYQNNGEEIPHYVGVLNEKKDKLKYHYGVHYGPHDLDRHDFIMPSGKKKVDIARDLGINYQIVPRVLNKMDAIEAARSFLNLSWIDEEKCGDGISGLDNYRKKWSKTLGRYIESPDHSDDWASDCADALMTGACGFVPNFTPPSQRDRYEGRSGGASGWAA